jgi:L-alanine-DL-glutamate epimerase-like enolase superfamily enzyme
MVSIFEVTQQRLDLNAICDPLDSDGYVTVPQGVGMGYDINWDFMESHGLKQDA